MTMNNEEQLPMPALFALGVLGVLVEDARQKARCVLCHEPVAHSHDVGTRCMYCVFALCRGCGSLAMSHLLTDDDEMSN